MLQRLACFHCGLPVEHAGRFVVDVDDSPREMCCAGCQAVAQSIVAAGLAEFYRHRAAPGGERGALPPELADLRLFDEPEVLRPLVREDGEHCEATLALDGLRCGACVWLIERSLAAVPGVERVSVNFSTERATLRWDPSRVGLAALLERIARVGYRAVPFDVRQREAGIRATSRALFRRLFIAGLGMMQVMMYAWPAYTSAPGDLDAEYASLLNWASLALTLPVIGYSASPFFAGAWRDLRARAPGMDVPVALGLLAAFAASVWATVSGRGEVYFDSVTMFVFLLLAARYLEWSARRRAGRAIDALAASLPETVREVDAEGREHKVPAARLAVGGRFRVDTGERIALDARIVEGSTRIDQSLLTGESTPVPRAAGEEVPGGAINAGAPVLLEALRPLEDSTASAIQRLIARSAEDKPRVARLADRIAAWFVLALLLLATAVFLYWWQADATRALPIAIAVLVVSCPCALSLATPAALAAATGSLVQHGVLITRGHTLEALAQATDVVFDKTGTLTLGRPRLADVVCLGDIGRERALALAAALARGSPHPLAQALRAAAAEAGVAVPAASELQSVAGAGLSGHVDGRAWRLGSAEFAGAHERDAPSGPDLAEDSGVWLADGDRVVARFALRDAVRDDAPALVEALRRTGLRLHLVSGDREPAVAAVAARLGIAQQRAGARPEDKVAYVRELQSRGARVLVVGDGINDAPVLAAADVSIAVGEATALARTAADAILLGESIGRVADARGVATRTRRIVVENLAWAMLYNALAIPAAALGWIAPWVAALGMSLSSLMVAGNAMRLWSWKRSTS